MAKTTKKTAAKKPAAKKPAPKKDAPAKKPAARKKAAPKKAAPKPVSKPILPETEVLEAAQSLQREPNTPPVDYVQEPAPKPRRSWLARLFGAK